MEKPGWYKPQLTVIVRRRPEEAVLTGCKVNAASSGPSLVNTGCLHADDCLGYCEPHYSS